MRSALIVGLALLLSACQPSLPRKPSATDSAVSFDQRVTLRDTALRSLQTYSVGGGLGIWTDAESVSAQMQWVRLPAELELTLRAPLGMGTVLLQSSAAGAEFSRGGTVIVRGGSADTVLQRGLNLAAPIPVSQLDQWLRGLPGAATSFERDAEGRLASLRFTDGAGTRWSARFLAYDRIDAPDELARLDVPVLISAKGGPYNMRLKLKNWKLTAADHQNAGDPDKLPKRLSIPTR